MIGEILDPLCRLVRPHFSDHIDGQPQPAHVQVGIRLHLTFCPWCRRTYVSLQATRDALKALAEAEPSADDEAIEVDEAERKKR